MTKENFAALLNGREYGDEIDADEERKAKEAGLIVIFGYSDDNVELRGVVHDEVSAHGGGEFYITQDGRLLEHHDVHCDCPFCSYKEHRENAREIWAVWDEEGYSWTFKTEIPHATFEILEDGQKFCRGIVIKAVVKPEEGA